MRTLACVLMAILASGGCSKSRQEQQSAAEKRLRNARLRKFKAARERNRVEKRMLFGAADAGATKQKVLRLPAVQDAGAPTADATQPDKPAASPLLGEGPPREPYDGKPDTMRPALVAGKGWDSIPLKQREKWAPLLNASTSFTLDLLGRLGRHRENISLAPWSLWSSLTVLAAGATGQTQKELRRLLHLSVGDAELRRRWKKLEGRHQRGLRRSGLKLRAAGGLWVGADLKLRPAATRGELGVGHASVQPTDVKTDPEKARVAMNTWLKKRLGKLPTPLVRRGVLHVDLKLLLTSAVSLSGALGKLFPKNGTFTGTFYLPDCKMVQLPMMNSRELDYFVSKSRDVRLVDIPLPGGKLSLTILMAPRQGRLEDLQSKLTSAKLRWWFGTLRKMRGKVTLPRLELGKLRDLAAGFQELGVKAAFGKRATFGALVDPGGVALETVLHRTPLILKETGPKARKPRPSIHRRRIRRRRGSLGFFPLRRRRRHIGRHYLGRNAYADRPFVLVLRHRVTGAILYLARVYNPRPAGRIIENSSCTQTVGKRPGWRRRRRRFGRHGYWKRSFVRKATVIGALDGDDVRKVIEKQRVALQKCVEDGHKAKPPLKGRITVSFTIRTNGTVGRVDLDYKYKKHPTTGACLSRTVRRMKFPKDPGEPTVVGVTVGAYHSRR